MNLQSFSGESLPPAVRQDIPMIATSSWSGADCVVEIEGVGEEEEGVEEEEEEESFGVDGLEFVDMIAIRTG
jgi:hypothetical protein